MKYFGLTDKGIVRLNNQDCFLTTEVRDRLVAVLCDGMGGHAAGELASKVASETFLAEVSAGLGSRTNRKPNIPALLKNACRSANHEVCEHALLSPAFEGMGSTLVGLCTDICVVSNALLLKANMPEVKFSVDPTCCAGVTPDSHDKALSTMTMCHIAVEQ